MEGESGVEAQGATRQRLTWRRGLRQSPTAGSKVKLRYSARLQDGTLFDERKEGNELAAVIEEGPHSTWTLRCSRGSRSPAR